MLPSPFLAAGEFEFLSRMIENALYLLALLNPVSKVMFLSSYDPPLKRRHIFELSWKSSLAALVILILLAGAGDLLLTRIFRVELYSLRITGGLVVFMIGWSAVREGRFHPKSESPGMPENFTDISLVPLAAPLIAGPGTIAAAISGTAEFGLLSTSLSLATAIGVNFVIMLFSPAINAFLGKFHALGPLIRLTGLIIAAVAVQMIITGIKDCVG
ncbi:MAG: MarC family protein [Lentisphaerae bacterium]|nr:MarC family protein [Lentisphaerota bacterium]